MRNAAGMEMAKVNAIIAKKLPQERMHRNPKSMNEISLEYNKFVGIGGWERMRRKGCRNSQEALNTTSSLVSGVGNGSPTVGRHPMVT